MSDPNLPNLLIIGHARHGKDTVAEYLRDSYGFKFTSSSMFVAQEALWDNWGCAVYDSIEDMYADRANHRDLWMQMIAAYNTPDKTKTASVMLGRGYNLYVGMRQYDELVACNQKNLFDHTIWVDRSSHLPPEPKTSMNLTKKNASYVLSNNSDIKTLYKSIDIMAKSLRF